MAENQADFTLTFRRLSEAAAGCEADETFATSSSTRLLMTPGHPLGGNRWVMSRKMAQVAKLRCEPSTRPISRAIIASRQ